MKLGIISDTHDRLPMIKAALTMFHKLNVEAILHAGDIISPFAARMMIDPHIAPDPAKVPLHIIYGNNDGEREGLKAVLPQIIDGPWRGTLGGRTIAMHHFIEWFAPEDLDGAQIVISGHTHEIASEVRNGVLYLNPGECCGWLTGRCTIALVETDTLETRIIDLA